MCLPTPPKTCLLQVCAGARRTFLAVLLILTEQGSYHVGAYDLLSCRRVPGAPRHQSSSTATSSPYPTRHMTLTFASGVACTGNAPPPHLLATLLPPPPSPTRLVTLTFSPGAVCVGTAPLSPPHLIAPSPFLPALPRPPPLLLSNSNIFTVPAPTPRSPLSPLGWHVLVDPYPPFSSLPCPPPTPHRYRHNQGP